MRCWVVGLGPVASRRGWTGPVEMVSGARLDGDRGRAALFVLQMEEVAIEPISVLSTSQPRTAVGLQQSDVGLRK